LRRSSFAIILAKVKLWQNDTGTIRRDHRPTSRIACRARTGIVGALAVFLLPLRQVSTDVLESLSRFRDLSCLEPELLFLLDLLESLLQDVEDAKLDCTADLRE
jgi:hypothetical protein